ncbi:MAG: HDOD domain-containing protein, partial [Planctomycetes bacterium]|nr:HDOD domain-containing protein [Planctomycetota bacterium]
LVNSPFFGLQYPVSSISQAVAIIGMNSLKSLVVAASTSALLMSDLGVYGFTENGLWDNSMATAALSRHIALVAGIEKEEAETYFLAGLLRDIGMLVLGPFLSDVEEPFTHGEIKGESDIIYREREVLGFDHCWVGARISEKWHLPEILHRAITCHHQQFHDLEDDDKKIVSIMRLAERLVYKSGVGVEVNHPFDRNIDTTILAHTGLSAEVFKELIADVPEIIDAVKMDF